MAKAYAVTLAKGASGKSTTAVNLGHGLVQAGAPRQMLARPKRYMAQSWRAGGMCATHGSNEYWHK